MKQIIAAAIVAIALIAAVMLYGNQQAATQREHDRAVQRRQQAIEQQKANEAARQRISDIMRGD